MAKEAAKVQKIEVLSKKNTKNTKEVLELDFYDRSPLCLIYVC